MKKTPAKTQTPTVPTALPKATLQQVAGGQEMEPSAGPVLRRRWY